MNPRPVPSDVSAAPVASAPLGAGAGWRLRLKAACIHAAIGAVVIGLLIGFVLLKWYQPPLATAAGVGAIILLLIAVDLSLGPVLTFAVFDPRKRSLKWDLAIIAAIQVGGLAYGIHSLDAGRPAWLVFVKDRFEMVAKADLRPADREAARNHAPARADWFGPRVIAAVSPEDSQARDEVLLEAVTGGRDLQHRPDLYRDYSAVQEMVRHRARPIAELRAIDSVHSSTIDAAVRATGRPEARLGFLPVRGPSADLAMLIDLEDGRSLGLVDARPWR